MYEKLANCMLCIALCKTEKGHISTNEQKSQQLAHNIMTPCKKQHSEEHTY
jgi:hypothetical protein